MPFLWKKSRSDCSGGAVYLTVPWLCACVLAFQIEKCAKGRDGMWYCCALGLFFSGASLMAERFREMVYGDSKFYLWLLAFLIFAILLAKQIWQICYRIEKWNQNLRLH